MSAAFFARAFADDQAHLPPEARLECKICWQVYDPAQGDEVWQIPAGTPFAQLPDHWTCPQCGSPKQDFLVLES